MGAFRSNKPSLLLSVVGRGFVIRGEVGGNSSWIGFVEIAYIQINYTAYQGSENVGLKHRIE